MLACDAVSRRRIVAPRRKPVTLKPVRPNLGIEAAYRRKLDALIDEMSNSLIYWLGATYKANTPEIAQDASPAWILRAAFRKLARRWQKRFDDAAPKLAQWFAQSTFERSDKALRKTLIDGGIAISEFKLSPAVNDVLQATIGEQVSLIKSIASEHLAEVEGAVMRSVQTGRDLGSLAKTLEQRYGVTKRRAAFIARDQNNKSTATITRARYLETGITEAIWLHSSGGKHPRASHQAASGKRYDVAKGMLIDGEYILPGEKFNCRCVCKPYLPGFD